MKTGLIYLHDQPDMPFYCVFTFTMNHFLNMVLFRKGDSNEKSET